VHQLVDILRNPQAKHDLSSAQAVDNKQTFRFFNTITATRHPVENSTHPQPQPLPQTTHTPRTGYPQSGTHPCNTLRHRACGFPVDVNKSVGYSRTTPELSTAFRELAKLFPFVLYALHRLTPRLIHRVNACQAWTFPTYPRKWAAFYYYYCLEILKKASRRKNNFLPLPLRWEVPDPGMKR
jgi:hypothetical protein